MLQDTDQLIRESADEAVRELALIARGPSAADTMKNLARRAMGRHPKEYDRIFWPAGLLLLGLLEADRVQEVKDYLNAWIADGAPVQRVDDGVAGYVLVRVLEEDDRPEYRSAAQKIWQFYQDTARDPEGSILYLQGDGNNRILADGAGQSAMFLAEYGRVFDCPAASAMARTQILNFHKYGFDRNTGLMYHGYEQKSGMKYGIIGWGRAAGWLLAGWACTLSSYKRRAQEEEGASLDTDAAATAELVALFRQTERNVLRYLRKDHLFSWQLEAMEGPSDTSATGMIAWALLHAQRVGIHFDFERETAMEIVTALGGEINGGKVYGSLGECIDFGQYPQQYGNNPWGQGAVLMFLGAMRKALDAGIEADHADR